MWLSLLTAAHALTAQPSTPGGGGESPPPSTTYSTNRLDLDVDGTVDFEIVHRHDVFHTASIGGWDQRNAHLFALHPMIGRQILASDTSSFPNLTVPTFAEGDTIGPAKPGQHWSNTPQVLLDRVEPFQLAGALGSVWVYAPGYTFIGVSLGTSESPLYGWIGFSRDRGTKPLFWGYGRQASAPVIAGDRSTAPTLTMNSHIETAPHSGRQTGVITWDPPFAEVILEEQIGLSGTWTPVTNSSSPQFYIPDYRIPFDGSTIAGEPRLYRVRFGP